MLTHSLSRPRRVFAAIALACVLMLAFAIGYLQHVVGLNPCPMCIVQREAFIGLALFSALAALSRPAWAQWLWGLLGVAVALFGAFTAARQSWLQWNPPEFASCGRDLYGMIESLPLSRVVPLVFSGSGECSAVDWTLLGGTIANWSFLGFVGLGGLVLLTLVLGTRRAR